MLPSNIRIKKLDLFRFWNFASKWKLGTCWGDYGMFLPLSSKKYHSMQFSAFIQENLIHQQDISFSNSFLCMLPIPLQSSLGCMTLSWRRPMVLRTFPKNLNLEETSKEETSKALKRVPPRVRMANSSLFSPPSQIFSRSSGVHQTIQTKPEETWEYWFRKLSQQYLWAEKPALNIKYVSRIDMSAVCTLYCCFSLSPMPKIYNSSYLFRIK